MTGCIDPVAETPVRWHEKYYRACLESSLSLVFPDAPKMKQEAVCDQTSELANITGLAGWTKIFQFDLELAESKLLFACSMLYILSIAKYGSLLIKPLP